MTTLIASKFREHLGAQFIESITEPANSVYYIVASKHTPFDGNDVTIPTPGDNNTELEVKVYEEGIFGKKVTAADVSQMTKRYNWTSGTVYDYYDPDDSNLFNKQYYAVVDAGSMYYIYKCLDNNMGTASTQQPSSTSENASSFITTSDGYTWKLMYKMDESTFEKFATSNSMPVVTSANVAGNTVAGAIDLIRVTNPGSGYIATLTGQFQVDDLRESIPSYTGNNTTYRLSTSASSNSDFYVGSAIYISSGTGAGQVRKILDYTSVNRVILINSAFDTAPSSDSTYVIGPWVNISGNGSNAYGYATVSSNSTVNNYISKINVVNRGSGYTYASGTITGNTGGISNTASVKVVIPPTGGHGYDAPSELGSTSIGISLKFDSDEGGFVTVENDYRKFILLKDPLFDNVHLTLVSEAGTFSAGETIYQYDGKTLSGTVSGNTTSSTLTGIGTELADALEVNDKVLVTDIISNTSCLRTVSSVTNATTIALSSNLSFLTTSAKITHVTVTATGIKSGNTSPYMTLTNAEPKFETVRRVVGATSGAVANIESIDLNEKNYNSWMTFDNRVRIGYSSSSGQIPEDALVFQTDITLSNAYFHSANATYIFLTSEKGYINPDPAEPVSMAAGSNSYTLGTNKYTSDVVKGSGKVLYIENNDPISRSSGQSETIRLILNF